MIRTELMGWKSSWSKYWIVPSSELVYICHQTSGHSFDLVKSRPQPTNWEEIFFDVKVILMSILICFQYNWTEWYFSSHCLWMAALLLTILRRRHEARGIIDEAVSDHLTSNMKHLLPISDFLCIHQTPRPAPVLTPITVINNQPGTEQSRALN